MKEITMDLKRVLGCNRLRWLRGKGGDEIERDKLNEDYLQDEFFEEFD